jgi:peptide/nickel transport system ATP-binding protein/oligopeptide transport system ATP-binding protein
LDRQRFDTGPTSAANGVSPLMRINDLRTFFHTNAGVVKAVDGVSLTVNHGEILAVVGESGCGKTMMARSILRLVPHPGRIVSGEIWLDGQDLLKISDRDMNAVRGNAITMVFQEPMASLNPVFTVGNQIAESLIEHRPDMSRADRDRRVIELMATVGIASPEQRIGAYPHQLSGGMRQRVMIAMALACGGTRLLIADEPTTALDVTIQAQILELFQQLQRSIGMSVMLITHDLGVVAEIANRVAVMYAGSIVEYADVDRLFESTGHPYTLGLLRSLPQRKNAARKAPLYTIPGTVPNLFALRPGCKFFSRCPYALADLCDGEEPPLEEIATGHWVRCRRVDRVRAEQRAQGSR